MGKDYQDILTDQGAVWNFTRKSFRQQLVPGKGVYTFAELGLTEGVRWDTRSMRVSANSNQSDETFLGHMRYSAFRDYWEFSSRREMQGRPINVASDNDTNLRIAPLPETAYWLTGEYEIAPETLIEHVSTWRSCGKPCAVTACSKPPRKWWHAPTSNTMR